MSDPPSLKATRSYAGWMPPPRPDWVAHILAEGECLDLRSVVPLDEESLLSWARRNTGLDDFGADDWYEPFKVYIKSLDEEAELHLMGRLMARAQILNLLETRLRIENEFRLHPEIADEVIAKPIVIMGQSRSGTSALLNLLSQDPRMGALLFWETLYPVPAPEAATYRSDPRIEKADRFIRQMVRVTPELDGMHEFSGAVPHECISLQALNFMSVAWLSVIGQAYSYVGYMTPKSMTPAYAYQRRVMQFLQWKNPRKHWVLKAPTHLNYLPNVLEVFPDACLVWTHRDPVKALASVVSLIGTFQWSRTDKPFNAGGSHDYLTKPDMMAGVMNRVIDWIEQGVVPKKRIYHMHYQDFVLDRIDTAARIYDYFDIGFPADSRRQMEEYVARNPREARPVHQYNVQTNVPIEAARAAFKRYQDYFNVPSEA